jgi:DNA invertase Pin-like site-specific DNA recombinase
VYPGHGDTLVVTKPDRLGRLAGNHKQVANDLQDQGVGLLALCQGIDTTTAGSRSFFHMLVAIAEFERNLIVGPARDGLAATRARAWKGDRRIDFLPHRGK